MSNYEQFVRISSQLCATNMYFELSIFFILLEILNTNLPNPGSAPECTGHLFTPLVEHIITWRHVWVDMGDSETLANIRSLLIQIIRIRS